MGTGALNFLNLTEPISYIDSTRGHIEELYRNLVQCSSVSSVKKCVFKKKEGGILRRRLVCIENQREGRLSEMWR